ncbi:hypothetical protein JW949_02100 [Candidatus Woesearchaeota archaeon]|nr:hypothetical protein [Candidatus Woesearchaeota archaeon]
MNKIYTKEQLEHYFNKLMKELKRIPTQKDINKASREKTRFPSLSVFLNRFGSWEKAKKYYGKDFFNKTKCKNCGNEFVRERKNQKFCSKKCRENSQLKKHKLTWYKENKIKDILGTKCKLCKFNYIKLCKIIPKKFNKRKTISEKDLVDMYNQYKKGNDKKKKEIKKKLKEDYILLCPNHYELWKRNIIEI